MLLAGLFVEWERRSPNPMLPLGSSATARFASANAVSFFMWAGLFGTLFLMAQFFQIALGHSPLGAGLRLLPWTAAPMVVAPIAGRSRRALRQPAVHGRRPGPADDRSGLDRLDRAPAMGYLQLGLALGIAGIGISLCFPTVANAVMASVPLAEAGIASGTNSMLRELGGVLGIAVLASVFARNGVYHSPHVFIDGFTQALWVGVGLSATGCAAALFVPAHTRAARAGAASRFVAVEASRA